MFGISTLKFVKNNEFLTNTVNFGTAPTFSKGSGSAFAESLHPSP